jgi:5'-3' exonuclease
MRIYTLFLCYFFTNVVNSFVRFQYSSFLQRNSPSLPISHEKNNFLQNGRQFPPSFVAKPTSKTSLYGIPKLFRWLQDLYPSIVQGSKIITEKKLKIDNLYLDMNGIIHQCTHANAKDPLELLNLNEKEMFLKIFDYTNRLYNFIQPSSYFVLAIDGVAPRAKMNQQRSRRFRASKEKQALFSENEADDSTSASNRLFVESYFDSNCITPGTEFMYRLGLAFRSWIEYKMRSDPLWQTGCEIIFSGPDVPGKPHSLSFVRIRFIRCSLLFS